MAINAKTTIGIKNTMFSVFSVIFDAKGKNAAKNTTATTTAKTGFSLIFLALIFGAFLS